MHAERRCDLCDGQGSDLLYVVNAYRIVRCQSCGLVFVGTCSSAEDLTALYDEPYWEDAADVGYDGYAAAEERKRRHFRTLLDGVEALVRPGAMLEVGSAYGYFLDEARRRGWTVRGIEPSAHAADYARRKLGLDVTAEPLSGRPIEAESLDAVVLWDVIEHLPDPRETLEAAHAWLRQGGILALSTGDIESLSSRIHGADWSLMTPPWHQFYFSRRTMRRLLAGTGFAVERMTGDGCVAADPASAAPRAPAPLQRVLLSRPVTRVARRLGAGMIMF